MPQLIETIDQIARQQQRDVLMLQFSTTATDGPLIRSSVIQWLNENQVPYRECYDLWTAGYEHFPCQGSLYIDLPFDLRHPLTARVIAQFEYPDESPKIPGVSLRLCTLDMALKNYSP